MSDGDIAAERIVELDKIASEAEGSSSGFKEAAQPGSSPGGHSDEHYCPGCYMRVTGLGHYNTRSSSWDCPPQCPGCKSRSCYDNFCGMRATDT